MTSRLQNDRRHAPQDSTLAATQTAIERYQGLLQTLSDAVDAKVSYVDAQQRYQYVNRQYEQWYDMSADQIVGKTPQELMGDEYQQVKPYVESALSGQVVNYECPLNFTDGQQRYLQITHIPHVNDASEVIGIFVVCVDITEQKHLRAKLAQLEANPA